MSKLLITSHFVGSILYYSNYLAGHIFLPFLAWLDGAGASNGDGGLPSLFSLPPSPPASVRPSGTRTLVCTYIGTRAYR